MEINCGTAEEPCRFDCFDVKISAVLRMPRELLRA